MPSSKAALISLTFPVIISMPIQPPTITSENKRAKAQAGFQDKKKHSLDLCF